MDQDLLARLRAAAAVVFTGSGILVAYAHGSRVTGRARPESDLDVGYYPPPGADGPAIGAEMALAARLSEAVGVAVDLRNLAGAPLDLRGAVLEEGVRVYVADESLRVELEADLLSRYHDYKQDYRRLKLDHLLGRLGGYLGVLRELAAVPRERFLADRDKLGNAKYHFVIAIECAIDIANHIIASERFRIPRDNADSFTVLAENSIVPAALRERLQAMAGFRNRLVHLYWEVDDARVRDYLESALGDIEEFLRAVANQSW